MLGLFEQIGITMKVIKAPNSFAEEKRFSIFLAGSIEMGQAEDWQSKVQDMLKDQDCLILNPRRDDWDSSWAQSKDNPHFREQVEWELDALEHAELILMYFDPNTRSPITLLELGLFASSKKMVVCCPEGFWRKGNVDIVCERYGIVQVETLEELFGFVRTPLTYI